MFDARDITEWKWFSTPGMVQILLYLLVTGNTETTLPKLSAITGLSTKVIRSCLCRLKSDGIISVKTTNRSRIITLLDSKFYHEGRQRADRGQTEGRQREGYDTDVQGVLEVSGNTEGRQRADRGQTEGRQKDKTEPIVKQISNGNPDEQDILEVSVEEMGIQEMEEEEKTKEILPPIPPIIENKKEEEIKKINRDKKEIISNEIIKKKSDKEKKIPNKIHYADYVLMTKEEFEKLVSEYGEKGANRMIDILNNYKGSKGKTYKSDYLAIRSWVVNRYAEEEQKQNWINGKGTNVNTNINGNSEAAKQQRHREAVELMSRYEEERRQEHRNPFDEWHEEYERFYGKIQSGETG